MISSVQIFYLIFGLVGGVLIFQNEPLDKIGSGIVAIAVQRIYIMFTADSKKDLDLNREYRINFINSVFPVLLEGIYFADRFFEVFMDGKGDDPAVYDVLNNIRYNGDLAVISGIDKELFDSINVVIEELNKRIRNIRNWRPQLIEVLTLMFVVELKKYENKGIDESTLARKLMTKSRNDIAIGDISNISVYFDEVMYTTIPNYIDDPYPNECIDEIIRLIKTNTANYVEVLNEIKELRKSEVLETIIPKLEHYRKTPL